MRNTVFDYLNDRIFSFYNEALELRKGFMCKPRFGIIYPTYFCNHNCIGCDYSELNSLEPKILLSENQFEYIINQFVSMDVRAVEFCGGGEPLLHPYINKAIMKLNDLNFNIGILTNGTAISDARAEMLARICSYIRISLESGSKYIFNKVKRPKDKKSGFELVISNIRKLLFYRDKLKSPCQISYKFAIDKNNMTDIENAIILANSIGVDSIQFKSIRNVDSELNIDEKRMINNELNRLKKKYKSVYILNNILPLHVHANCWLSPLHIVVDPNGDVFICCYYRHRMKDHKIGNIFEKNLKEIWYSFEHYSKIRNIQKEQCELYDCRFIRYNDIMQRAIDKGQLDFI